MAETAELTLEQAANAFDGLLSGEDGTQEPEKEGADETEVEAGDEAEGEPAEEAEESEDAEQEEEQEEEPNYTVKIDGKDAKVPLSELLKGYQRTADYTRKTQDIASQRKAVSDLESSLKAEREHYSEKLKELETVLTQNAPQEPDWDTLLATNPVEYLRQQRLFMQRQNHMELARQEQEKLAAAKEAEESRSKAEYLVEQEKKLFDAIPEWKDVKIARKEKADMVEYARTIGYEPDEIAQVADHRAVVLLRKAMLLDQQKTRQAAIKPTVTTPAVKTARGGTSQQTPANDAKRAMKRLSQTHDVYDAAAAIMQLG